MHGGEGVVAEKRMGVRSQEDLETGPRGGAGGGERNLIGRLLGL